MEHVREFSVHKQIINYSSALNTSPHCTAMTVRITEMTIYRAMLIVHRACKLH